MTSSPFPETLFTWFGQSITSTWLTSLGISLLLMLLAVLCVHQRGLRRATETVYELLEGQIRSMVEVDPRELVPLVLTLWLFIGCANLIGLLPGLSSPTGDLSLAAALAAVSFIAGHIVAFRKYGFRYFKRYVLPTWFLLPFNIIGELSRTLALSLRLFGNALSANLIAAILVYLGGFLVPVPMLLLSVLTGVVQAYIFGVLVLVFAASAMEVCLEEKGDSA